MPVEFLSDEQAAAFGRFVADPAPGELERFFFLDDVDLELVARRRGEHNRLGFAVQLGTVRFLGTFLADPLDVPWAVVDYLSVQLDMADASVVKQYAQRLPTQHEHAAEIRDAYGYRDFGDPAAAELRAFLAGRAWTQVESQLALFDQAAAWLRRHRVLLPGPSVLARVVAQVRDESAIRLHTTLVDSAAAADPTLPERLQALLLVDEPDGGDVRVPRWSRLEVLRRPPTRTSGRAMAEALSRAQDVLAVGARAADVETVPAGRLAVLARYGLTSKTATIGELAEPRRTAVLLATARALESSAVDDALDLFDVLMATRLIGAARRAAAADRLAALPRLERASATLAAAARALLAVLEHAGHQDEQQGDGDQGDERRIDVAVAWAAVERVASRVEVAGAAAVVEELVPAALTLQGRVDPAEDALRRALADRYTVVRPFLRLLAEALPLRATPAAEGLLAQVRRLPELARRKVTARPLLAQEIDPGLVPPAWRRAVFLDPPDRHGPGARAEAGGSAGSVVNRDAFVVCVLEQLHAALGRRDVFAVPSVRWADPRAQLLAGPAWDAVRRDVVTGLGLTDDMEQHLADLTGALDGAWRQLGDRLAQAGPDARVRMSPTADADGRLRLAVDRLEAVGEPASLLELRGCVAGMLPRVDLPEVLLEVHGWTGFLQEYTHVGHLAPRMEALPLSVAALLVAQACNVGLTPVVQDGAPALTRDRLSHVDQNYLRAETHSAANARLIDAQAAAPVAGLWGGGLVASVDGLRFVVPVQSIVTGPSPRYFGLKRGVTWLNAVNDQVAGIGAVVVPGTMRDSLYILDTLLGLDGGPKPEMVATDTASYSDIVFGLFRLLGYRFSPRIADLPDQRFWRADPPAAAAGRYGPAEPLARHRVDLGRIRGHWPDMLRVAGSLVTGRVRAYGLLRMLGRDGHPTPLGRAFAEYGRIAKTLHLLAFVDPDDETYRRTVHRQLTVQESRHALARAIFHGRRGHLHQAYRSGQEDQLGALGLVLNAVVLWNTRYIDAAVTALRATGLPSGARVLDEDVARLSPLVRAHLNVLGRYSFATPDHGPGLRPLRDPDSHDLGDPQPR